VLIEREGEEGWGSGRYALGDLNITNKQTSLIVRNGNVDIDKNLNLFINEIKSSI
jgi:hypothetical protein